MAEATPQDATLPAPTEARPAATGPVAATEKVEEKPIAAPPIEPAKEVAPAPTVESASKPITPAPTEQPKSEPLAEKGMIHSLFPVVG